MSRPRTTARTALGTLLIIAGSTTWAGSHARAEEPSTAPAPAPRAGFTSKLPERVVEIGGKHWSAYAIGRIDTQIAALVGEDARHESGDAAEEPGFRLRRARVGLGGALFERVEFEFELEMATGQATLNEAWVGYRRHEAIGFVVGSHKMPFSRWELVGSGKQSLNERPFGTRALAPSQQVGFSLVGEVADGLFSYQAGVFNGLERHTSFHEGFVQNAGVSGNDHGGVSAAVRVSLEPLGRLGAEIADFDGGGFRLGVGGSFYYNAGTTVSGMGWEADLALKVAHFHLAAEFAGDTAEPQKAPTTPSLIPAGISRQAVAGELGYLIDLALFGIGIAARAEWLDADTDDDALGQELAVTGGLQLAWARHHLKATLDYTHRTELDGVELDNDVLMLGLQLEL